MSARGLRGILFRLSAFLLACAACGAQTAAAGYVVEEMVLLPPRFYVGDSVECRLLLRVQEGLAASEPAALPEDPWFDIRRVRVEERRGPVAGLLRVRIFFTPFRPGSSVLPSLQLGALSLSGVEVNTASVLEGQEKPTVRGLRAPLRVPRTALRLLGAGLAVAALPAVAGFAALAGARGLKRLGQLRRRRRPYARLQRSLERLRALCGHGEGEERRDFFILLSLTLKRYLSERLHRSVMSATTAEIQPQLEAAGLESRLAAEVHELLARADLVKFSGRGGSRREMQADLTRLEGIAGQVEESHADVES